MEEVFAFWKSRLPDWSKGFGATACLLHFLSPDSFELADHHRIEAMLDLLREIGHVEEVPVVYPFRGASTKG
ncbi:hypothetical protein [Gorillibacterium massiliense]|uniref:hypothetical protein n=1 Tax=Gorillibacterium massiliense TaxID=1280390 RepID=UPI0004B7283B|nr:hypothetical protein [Gorillibacterium massiliense]